MGQSCLSNEIICWKGIEIEDIPVVRRFVESPSPYFEIQKYKELREEVNTATTRLKDLITKQTLIQNPKILEELGYSVLSKDEVTINKKWK